MTKAFGDLHPHTLQVEKTTSANRPLVTGDRFRTFENIGTGRRIELETDPCASEIPRCAALYLVALLQNQRIFLISHNLICNNDNLISPLQRQVCHQ